MSRVGWWYSLFCISWGGLTVMRESLIIPIDGKAQEDLEKEAHHEQNCYHGN